MIRSALRATVRGVGVVLLTAVEVAALSVWFGLVADAPPISLAVIVGVAALAAGLFVEGLLTYVTVNGWRREAPSPSVALLALGETLLWVAWFAAFRQVGDFREIGLLGLALAVALVVRHTVTDNLLRGRRALSSLVGRVPAGLAAVEAAGATAWLLVVSERVAIPEWFAPVSIGTIPSSAVVGGALLAVVLVVQHALAVRYALRTSREVERVGWRSSWGTPPE
ncbi:hypothetical protein [Halorussus amylolyticus]|uniref:hypothetical protein n=1 Tax=Halorussus amylolyticus TaxID=1126242 RepID=UPI001049C792|nr:hypothetical protein [Halorussus amylolyticus]